MWSSAQTSLCHLVHSGGTSTKRLRGESIRILTVLANGGIGHGFDTIDNSGSVAPGRGAQMAPQQKLGIRT